MNADYLLIILGMGVVTYTPRALPLLLLARRSLPRWFTRWLSYIPAAVISALLLPDLITTGAPRELSFTGIKLWVALPTLLVAWRTKSLGASVFSGMFFYWAAEKLLA